ncbi:MAG: response regulator transcription factor [Chitinophagaceae bacterium]|nr:response regulator transcription factor [Chitinophagaceae bacterium]
MITALVLYEDNTRLRQSMEMLLDEASGYKVTGSFSDCDNVIDDLKNCNPEMVIMDIDMPGIGGIEGVKRIKQNYPEVKVVMHTVFDDDNRIFESICAGADGYLLKNTAPLKLIQMLEDLMQGGAAMSPFVAQRVFQYFRQNNKVNDEFHLTAREKEILELLVKGNSYKMIADKTAISIDTVKKHLQNIYHKLHVNCGTEAVAKALQHKIIRLD